MRRRAAAAALLARLRGRLRGGTPAALRRHDPGHHPADAVYGGEADLARRGHRVRAVAVPLLGRPGTHRPARRRRPGPRPQEAPGTAGRPVLASAAERLWPRTSLV